MENQQERELTPEELAARKEEMKQFYDESLPYLESQVKYEKLLTEIEEARFKRANWQYQWAVLMENSKAPSEEDDDEVETPAPERKLKKG
jgi:threonyl-tRNA synthetase